jgi:tetrahydromethanopterin S-methyltransferase subunit H
MLEFKSPQKTFTISGIKMGGQPSQNPTVLIGSIFFRGHNIVSDGRKGIFDVKTAEELINVAQDFSDKTGLPSMLDVVAETHEATVHYLDFVAGVCDMPILLDIVSVEAVAQGIDYIREAGLEGRTIFNSITPDTKDNVLEKLNESGIRSAVLLLYSPKTILSTEGRLEALEKLLPVAKKAGVENTLVDTVVLDIPSLGMASKAIFEVKDRYGLPAGCGAHNACDQWKGLKAKMGKQAYIPSIASACSLPVALGADFVLYGPLDLAPYIFPSLSLINAAYGQLLLEKRQRPERTHPRFRIA